MTKTKSLKSVQFLLFSQERKCFGLHVCRSSTKTDWSINNSKGTVRFCLPIILDEWSSTLVLKLPEVRVANQVAAIHHDISRCLYLYLQQQLITEDLSQINNQPCLPHTFVFFLPTLYTKSARVLSLWMRHSKQRHIFQLFASILLF